MEALVQPENDIGTALEQMDSQSFKTIPGNEMVRSNKGPQGDIFEKKITPQAYLRSY